MSDPAIPKAYQPKTASKAKRPGSNMAKRLAPSMPPIPSVYDQAVAKKANAPKKRALVLRSGVPVDDQLKVRSSFSEAYGDNAGESYSEPLQIDDASDAAGKPFYWRGDVDQFRADPLLQGCELRWDLLTPGWSFIDGAGIGADGAFTYDELVSNAAQITRVVKAPAAITVSPRFRIVLTRKYRQ